MDNVVRGGALSPNGMPRFPELTDAQMRALYMVVRQGAREAIVKK